VEGWRMLSEVMTAPRSAASSATGLRAHVLIGAMFRLQRSISSLEPHTSNFDDRGRGCRRNQIGKRARGGMFKVSRLSADWRDAHTITQVCRAFKKDSTGPAR
jgi:hypothetical protein